MSSEWDVDPRPSTVRSIESEDIVHEAVITSGLGEGKVVVMLNRPLAPQGITLTVICAPERVVAETALLLQKCRDIKMNRTISKMIEDALNADGPIA